MSDNEMLKLAERFAKVVHHGREPGLLLPASDTERDLIVSALRAAAFVTETRLGFEIASLRAEIIELQRGLTKAWNENATSAAHLATMTLVAKHETMVAAAAIEEINQLKAQIALAASS